MQGSTEITDEIRCYSAEVTAVQFSWSIFNDQKRLLYPHFYGQASSSRVRNEHPFHPQGLNLSLLNKAELTIISGVK